MKHENLLKLLNKHNKMSFLGAFYSIRNKQELYQNWGCIRPRMGQNGLEVEPESFGRHSILTQAKTGIFQPIPVRPKQNWQLWRIRDKGIYQRGCDYPHAKQDVYRQELLFRDFYPMLQYYVVYSSCCVASVPDCNPLLYQY